MRKVFDYKHSFRTIMDEMAFEIKIYEDVRKIYDKKKLRRASLNVLIDGNEQKKVGRKPGGQFLLILVMSLYFGLDRM